MSEWIKTTLNEIADVIGGGTPSTKNEAFWGGKIPWITPKDLTGYTKMYISHGERFITKNGLDNSSARLLPEGTVLMSSRAPIGYVAIAANPITTNQGFKSLVPNAELANNKFLYFWIKNNKQYIDSLGSGTTFAEVSGSVVKSLEIELPPLAEQKAIASVLSALDNKIDLLHRQNKTLESMAEMLFRQWFVEEAQDDWEEVNVLNIFSLVGGGTPKTSIDEYWNGNIPWISGGDISQSHKGFISKTEKSITELGLKNSSTKLLPKLSTIISARGTVGKYALLEQEMCFSQSNYGIIPKGHNCYYFVYLLIGFIVDELLAAAYGSVFDTITTRTFESVDLKLPEMTVIANFEKTVIEFFKKKESNTKQIQTLENLRDTLLPKLMSGEVRVNYRPEEIKQ